MNHATDWKQPVTQPDLLPATRVGEGGIAMGE